MLRLLVYLLLLSGSASFLYGLFSILLLPEHLHSEEHITLNKTREEVYYFLRDSQYFPLWQAFEKGVTNNVNKYNFGSSKSEKWDSVSIEHSQNFNKVVILEDRPLEFLKLRYYLNGMQSPLDVSLSLSDLDKQTKLIWGYDLPVRNSFWDLGFHTWKNVYKFYNLHKLFRIFVPSLTNTLANLHIAVPFELNYNEQNLAQLVFWIYAENSLVNDSTNAKNLSQQRAKTLELYLRNRPTFIRDSVFYWQKEDEKIRVGQIIGLDKDSIIDKSNFSIDNFSVILQINKLFIHKKYQVSSFSFPGSELDLLDSLHRHFPFTMIKSKNNLTLGRIYLGEDLEKYPYRSHISWLYLSKF